MALPSRRLEKVTRDFSPYSTWATFERVRPCDLQRASQVAEGIRKVIDYGGHFAWEWDSEAHYGCHREDQGACLSQWRAPLRVHGEKGDMSTKQSVEEIDKKQRTLQKVCEKGCPGHRDHDPRQARLCAQRRCPWTLQMLSGGNF